MKNLFYICLSFLVFACASPTKKASIDIPSVPTVIFKANPQPVQKQEVKTLSIGAVAPDFNLPGTDGKFYTRDDFKKSKALAIVFTCNHCPTAQAYEGRIKKVAADYKKRGLALVAISPNSPLGLLYEELGYSDLNDDFEEMKIRAKDQEFNFPYLYDGDTETASLKYGPVATPHVFLFDENRKLAYKGRLDKIEKPGKADAEDLRLAIESVLNDQPVETPVTKTFGCSTKWGWKLALKEKVNKEWKEKPVSVEKLDVDGIKKIIKNEESQKLRLINVWATWCGPCVLEFPDFVVLQRMFGDRDFEFISLSADKPSNEKKVLKFLKEKHAVFPNYIFAEDDKYALIEALDPDWNGALPYSILIEPNGKVVWKQQGEVDFYELKKTIVDHKMIGRYF